MGTPTPDFPDLAYPPPGSPEDGAPTQPDDRPVPRTYALARRPERMWKYALLFVLTMLTTTVAGAMHYAGYSLDFTDRPLDLTAVALYANGFWYSLSILAILGSHELGHYYACRYYGVDASLPYFLPAPLPLTGTLGAFIRIRQPIPTKRQLFDIGIAGPIAGFIVTLPVLFFGMRLSRVVPLPTDLDVAMMELGEPLLLKAVAWLQWGEVPDGYSINMHPMAFAAWFGLLATALNLFPIGQLDGGHISYAVLGRRSTLVTMVMVAFLFGLTFVSSSWMVWAALTIAMLWVFGPRHPRTLDEDVPLDPVRKWVAVFALVMFVLCFTPAPIEPMQIITRS